MNKITEEDYFLYFDNRKWNNNDNKEVKENVYKEAFKIALDTRKFEIELYWKRSNYFTLFIGIVFVGLYTIYDKSDSIELSILEIILSILGYFLSLLWYLSNRGSKFWHENWEEHISVLGRKIGCPIFDIGKTPNKKITAMTDYYPFSVTKINHLVSIFITISWFVILISLLAIKVPKTFNFDYKCCYVFIYLIALTIFIVLNFFIIQYSKGFATRYNYFEKKDKKLFFIKSDQSKRSLL